RTEFPAAALIQSSPRASPPVVSARFGVPPRVASLSANTLQSRVSISVRPLGQSFPPIRDLAAATSGANALTHVLQPQPTIALSIPPTVAAHPPSLPAALADKARSPR